MKAKYPYNKRKKRVGFGVGSGHGKTATRGQKGQNSRSGSKRRIGFEGGQNPLYRRLPKRGFNNNAFREKFELINIERLAVLQDAEVTPEILRAKNITKTKHKLKVLGNGEIKKSLIVKAHRFSESAKSKIEKAGGQAIVI